MIVVDPVTTPQAMLAHVFDALEEAGVEYCLLHPPGEPAGSDVDVVVSLARLWDLAPILRDAASRGGYLLVQAADRDGGVEFVLAGRRPDGASSILKLDVSSHPTVRGRRFYTGPDLLRARRRDSGFWVPSAAIEFGCSLTRRVAKGGLTDEQGARLSAVYAADPSGCEREAARFWGPEPVERIIAAARSGRWQPVRDELPRLADALLRRGERSALQGPVRAVARTRRRARNVLRPVTGLHVLFLGPDGAGKSTVIHGIARDHAGAFSGVVFQTTAPSLSALRDGSFRVRALKPPGMPLARPHSWMPHSLVLSLVQAAYWAVYYIAGYQVTTRPALASGMLVLQHRGLLDALVDAKRYRYGGPRWPLRLVWRLAPKPDLLILLDAPSEQIRERKPELPLEEITRQRREYLALVKGLRFARVVDAGATAERTIAEVANILLRSMADRVARRIGPRGASGRRAWWRGRTGTPHSPSP